MSKWDVIHFGISAPTLRQFMDETHVAELIGAGVLNWEDFAKPSNKDSTHWLRLFEIEEFRSFLPPFPAKFLEASDPTRKNIEIPNDGLGLKELELPTENEGIEVDEVVPDGLEFTVTKMDHRRVKWFIQLDGTEFGPFSLDELKLILKSGKLTGEIYLWKTALENWVPLTAFPSLLGLVPSEHSVRKKVRKKLARQKHPTAILDARTTHRHPLIATVALAGEKNVVGVCADVSENGLQVIIDGDFEAEIGSTIKLKITPLGVTGLRPFSVKVVVAWIRKPDARAGFKFSDLAQLDQKALQVYLNAIQTRSGLASAA